MIVIICLSVGVGLIFGAIIVGIIWLRRRHQVIDSLIPLEQLIGFSGIVEVPFDCHSQGKVCINASDSILHLRALTDEHHRFAAGDRIVVIATQADRVWVVSEQVFKI
jgi:hypothetical protein